jgi:hypothetical protein
MTYKITENYSRIPGKANVFDAKRIQAYPRSCGKDVAEKVAAVKGQGT